MSMCRVWHGGAEGVTPAEVPERFERVMGCTGDELRSWLARALQVHA